MKAEESKILDILTENKKYVIPSYQRPYSWSAEHAEQLIKDIYESFREDAPEYFIGSLICIEEKNQSDIYEVVDGQQRLTTLSLILAKIRDLSSNSRLKETLQKRILPIDEFSDKPQEPRLLVRKKEEDLYKNYILQGNSTYLPKEDNRSYTENLFIKNFQTIEDYLTREINDDDDLRSLTEYILKNVYVVLVKTESFASAYRLFNVLNTRGLSLKQSDLLKNNLFEIAETYKKAVKPTRNDGSSISQKIEEYWESIEDIVGIENMDKFLVLHETSRKKNRNKAVAVFKIAEHFTKVVKDEHKNDAIDFVLALKRSAKNYQRLKEISFDNPSTYRIIQCLSELYEEWIPPMLAFLNRLDQVDCTLSENDFNIFTIEFEKCYINRWFAHHNKSQREVICYDVVANINNNLSIGEIKQELKKHTKNEALLQYLQENIYEARSNKMYFLKYILHRLDQEMQDNSVYKTYTEKVTIEHILPQNMESPYWSDRFSKEDHLEWVNKLGNLTLISGHKNSKAQNEGFDKKLKIYEGNGKSVSFDISKNVLKYADWNVESIRHRHNFLIDIAKAIWSIK